MKKQTIGKFILKKATRFQTSEQTACNYRTIEVPAGEYPITMGKHYEGGMVMTDILLPGIIVESHFVNRLFASSSMADTSSEIGKPYEYRLDYYQWTLAEMVATGDERIKLDKGFAVKAEQYEQSGRTFTMHNVVEVC